MYLFSQRRRQGRGSKYLHHIEFKVVGLELGSEHLLRVVHGDEQRIMVGKVIEILEEEEEYIFREEKRNIDEVVRE